MVILIHAFLSHLASIQRLFEPQKPLDKRKIGLREFTPARGTALKEALFTGRSQPPKIILDLRNDFEHFDERLDAWVIQQGDVPVGLFSDWVLVVPGAFNIWAGEKNTPRRYDIGKGILYFHGDELDLRLATVEVRRVLKRAKTWDSRKYGSQYNLWKAQHPS